VALAVQNILGDIFASLSIVIDKPFVIGDQVAVGDLQGTVESIGLKTTRLRATTGEQLVFANGDLLKNRIRNLQRMSERRVTLVFGVAQSTPAEKLEEVPALVRAAVGGRDRVRFERAHLKGIGPASFDFEMVFLVTTAEVNVHMDRQQEILLALLRSLADRGIELAPSGKLQVEAQAGGAGKKGLQTVAGFDA
jgi:small-conductance mechanosensitive channel